MCGVWHEPSASTGSGAGLLAGGDAAAQSHRKANWGDHCDSRSTGVGCGHRSSHAGPGAAVRRHRGAESNRSAARCADIRATARRRSMGLATQSADRRARMGDHRVCPIGARGGRCGAVSLSRRCQSFTGRGVALPGELDRSRAGALLRGAAAGGTALRRSAPRSCAVWG